MNTLLAAGLISILTQGAPIDQNTPRPISLNFSQTDVGQIFRAIGMRTGANIIYSGSDKILVTLHFNAASADEAIRGTTASAGLAYRRVGKIYVVAKPESLRQALAPFAERARIKTEAATPELAKQLQDVIPNATITSAPGEIQITGISEDIRLAEELVNDRVMQSGKDPRKVEVVNLGVSAASKIAEVIGSLFPNVKATALADSQGGGGTLALIGRDADVAAAKAKALDLDAATPTQSANVVVETYDVRYVSAATLEQFLHDAAPDVQLAIAPPNHIPGALMNSAAGGNTLGSGTSGASGGSGLGGGSGSSAGSGSLQVGGGGTPGGGAQGDAANGGALFDRSTRVVLKGRRADVDAALDLLRKIDVAPRQVVVEVRIVDASPTDIEKYGIKYSWDTFQFSDQARGTTFGGSLLQSPGIGTISRLPLNFLAQLDLMVAKTDAKLMANPSIQVLNNQEANFFVGDQLSFPVTTSGALGQQNVEIKDYQIGIALNVRPRVNADGNITMRLNPVVQSLTGLVNGLPQTASRTASTVVMVKDGETVALGGLIRDEDTRTITQIPLLSQLPIVGQLFRHTDRNHRKSNIIVTVTPHLVPAAQEG